MPGPMPFHLEKGPWICALEDLINGVDDEQVMGIYEKLTVDSEAPFRELVKQFAEQPSLVDDPNYNTYELRYGHLLGHWFGDRDGKPQVRFEQWLAGAARSSSDRIDVPEGDLTPDRAETLLADACERGLLQMLATSPDRVVGDGAHGQTPGSGVSTTAGWRRIVRRTFAEALKVALGLSENGADVAPAPGDLLEVRSAVDGGMGDVEPSAHGTRHRTSHGDLRHARNGRQRAHETRRRGIPPAGPRPRACRTRGGAAGRSGGPVSDAWHVADHARAPPPAAARAVDAADRVGALIVPAIGPAYAGIGEVTVVAPRFVNGGMPEVEPAVTKRRPAEPPPERESTTASS